VDTDTEEEPMELPDDHPEVSSGSNEGPAGGDGGDSGAADGDKDKGDAEDSDAPGDDDDDPDDGPEPAVTTNPPPPEPRYEKQILHLESTEGPFPALLWRAMQRIGFPRKPHFGAHLFRNAQQEEEWLVSVLICVPDERPGCWVEYSKHIDEVPRRTLEAGISEAARRALYFLCYAYKEELQGAVSTAQEGSYLCADSCSTPWGRKPAHGYYTGAGRRSQHGSRCSRGRDPGGQEEADEDHQGEGNSGGSAERRSSVTSGV
jgi:hypothetical protein